MALSKWYIEFLKDKLNNVNADQCIDIIEKAFNLSTHLVRVRSVARAAGFCVYYGRMSEKMGVYEVLEAGSAIRGRAVHGILSVASFNLFVDNPYIATTDNLENIAKKYIQHAVDETRDFLKVNSDDVNVSVCLMKRLLIALPKAKRILDLDQNEPLFPIIEQTLADYRFRLYGVPDLVLENMKKRKAIVIEWKTYMPEVDRASYPNDFEIAQVIAYSILEARRLGYKELMEIFEKIAGLPLEKIKKIIDEYNSGRSISHYINSRYYSLLSVLPIIVSRSGSYPPHPLMYNDYDQVKFIKRLVRLYRVFRGVVVATEYLTLQLMNIPKLLSLLYPRDVRDKIRFNGFISKTCLTENGYLAFSYSPFKFLKAGKPGDWDKYPCKLCPFRGDGGPCDFYFGKSMDKDYFDKLMWWARYKVYWERERDLVNHKAMFKIFESSNIVNDITSFVNSYSITIDIYSSLISPTLAYVNRVSVVNGAEVVGKFRFDLFKIQDVVFDEENQVIELVRDLRDCEIKNNVVGLLRKSIYLAILEKRDADRVAAFINPLHSINAFVMIDDAEVEDNKVVYRCYNPSPALYLRFNLFGRYLNWYRRNIPEAFVLAYEAPVDLTIMELRAIDVLHRYLKKIASNPSKIIEKIKKYGINLDEKDLLNEVTYIKKYIPSYVDTSGVSYDLYECFRSRLIKGDGKD